MKGFADFILEMNEYNQLLSDIKKGVRSIDVSGISETQKAHMIFSLCLHTEKPSIIVTYSDLQAKKLYEDMQFFVGDRAKLFPSKEYIFYEVEAYSTDIIRQRLEVLNSLCTAPEKTIVITTEKALRQIIMPSEIYKKNIKTLTMGLVCELQSLVEDFIVMGYERVDMVEGRGQFSMRGGIVDFYPIISECAYRIEFFDDEIDSIRVLDIMTQRSVDKVKEVRVGPAREAILTKKHVDRIVTQINDIARKVEGRIAKGKYADILEGTLKHLKADIEKFKQQHYFASLDKYLPLIYSEQSTILEYLSGNTITFLDEPLKIEHQIKSTTFEFNETIKAMMEKGLVIEDTSRLMIDKTDFMTQIVDGKRISLSALIRTKKDNIASSTINITGKILHSFHGKLEFLYEDLERWKKNKYRIVILAGTKNRGIELVKILEEKNIHSIYMDELNEVMPEGQIVITQGSLTKGFEYPLIRFVIISDKEIFRQNKKRKSKKTKKSASTIKSFTDLNVGDFIVHQNHGIGRYMGSEKLIVEGITKDYLKIKYQGDDFLYVPTNQLDIVQKYIGGESKRVRLHKLGGADWTKAKAKVKKSVQDLAKGLIELYATRQSIKGHAFSSDTTWQRQFEDTFPYEETQDQLRCICEVKEDMENVRCMDRLLCGDVGYGKTEIAMRAAFKAVMDGKQVAYLVPTTILAQQHYSNFTKRMNKFPITVEMLSRFRSPSEQKNIIKKLKTGEIDIIIGTHRILQKDLLFKDVGLLIIDEEQRFGVTHKEKLKEIRKNIDVLTLTATPIPRTLHMSMIGVRDMSILEEPPEDRYPVQTYVLEYNHALIRDAILKEISRRGQVYYLYNRVQGIYKVAESLRQMIPDAKIAVGHGQMNERELEDIMLKVLHGEIDVLVCTTIIETGLDIPNVNTIIIEDADRMGLSQLYQLRGRVGRSNRLAYAYICYKKDKVLQESAEKRLQAIKEFTEFGAGFKIAMRDLEIRGAGNILGPEQHGHMDAVGYDMYCKLLEESVRELKGEKIIEQIETTVELNVDAYIPDTYIKRDSHRVDIYKKIASIQNLQDAYDVEEEIEDRYGDLPASVRNLIQIALIKSLANQLRISAITQKENRILIQFYNHNHLDMRAIFELVENYKGQMLFNASDKPYLSYKYKNKILDNIKIILQNLKQLQSV